MVFRQQTCVETRPLVGHGHRNCSFIVQYGGDGPWILVVVGGGPGFGGSEGGAFGQGQVALVADMGGNMTSR